MTDRGFIEDETDFEASVQGARTDRYSTVAIP